MEPDTGRRAAVSPAPHQPLHPVACRDVSDMQKMTRRLKRKYDDFHHVAPVSMAILDGLVGVHQLHRACL